MKPRVDRFWEGLLQRMETLPGVHSAAVASPLWIRVKFQVAGQAPTPPAQRLGARYQVVSPSYFRTLGVPLIRGRTLAEQDVEGSRWVAVMNETAARQFFPDEDPLGQRIQVYFGLTVGVSGALLSRKDP